MFFSVTVLFQSNCSNQHFLLRNIFTDYSSLLNAFIDIQRRLTPKWNNIEIQEKCRISGGFFYQHTARPWTSQSFLQLQGTLHTVFILTDTWRDRLRIVDSQAR